MTEKALLPFFDRGGRATVITNKANIGIIVFGEK